jgi:hypothetical protein
MGRLALPEAQRPQRYVRKEGNIAYSSGNTTPQLIGQTAYLTSLDLISLQTTTTTTTAPTGGFGTTAAGAFSPLANVQVKVNGGRAPFSMPGYHADVFARVWDRDYSSDLTTNPNVGNVTNTWVNHLRLPLTVDPSSERGAFYAGDTALNITFALTMNPITSVFQTVNAATLGGSWDLYSEKFEAPQPDQSASPDTGGWLDKISYYAQAELFGTFGLSNGVTNITLETDQDFLRIILIFYTGSLNAFSYAPANALYTTVTLKINDVASIWDTVAEARMRFEQDISYQQTLPAGTCVFDFMRLDAPPTRRDILPTDPNIAKRVMLQVASTSSSNNVDVITHTVTDDPFAVKWVNLAAAQAKRAG